MGRLLARLSRGFLIVSLWAVGIRSGGVELCFCVAGRVFVALPLDLSIGVQAG